MTRQPTTGALTAPRLVTLVRYRPGVAGETARTVHLVPLPVEGLVGAATALCGTPLRREDVDPVPPGRGMPCMVCVLSHVTGDPPPPPVTTGDTRVDPDPLAATAGYQAWGWPVTLRHDQIRLNLDGDTLALIIPVLLATEVIAILATRRCPVPVLAHPYAPEHRILLVAERFGVTLPWPPGVHQVTGTLLLPPTVTPRGPITWIQLPEPEALPLCREIDVLAALHTALNDPRQG
ncbi:MAG: hypothetical protein ACRDTA_21805 [Pseudonocardiaceae bacterium]